MAEQLSRRELYDLVWSEPMKTLAKRFGISDVALKKTCARAHVPTPNRGYWAKREASKRTIQIKLPERPPGMDDEVVVGGGGGGGGGGRFRYRCWTKEELLAPLPARPEFDEPLEALRDRIAKVIGKVTVPREVRLWHPFIERLLEEDEERRKRQLASRYRSVWDNPLFEAPVEQRRLRILNSLFLAVARMDGKPTIRGRETLDIHVTFHQQHVAIALDQPKQPSRRSNAPSRSPNSTGTQLVYSILRAAGADVMRYSWRDDEKGKLEARMTEITVETVLTAEMQRREDMIREYEWHIRRKAELEEEARLHKLESERAERERQERLEQARIDRLLRDAAAFHQAEEIRKYVEAMRRSQLSETAVTAEKFGEWSRWALAEADRIDPVLGGRFLDAMEDEEPCPEAALTVETD